MKNIYAFDNIVPIKRRATCTNTTRIKKSVGNKIIKMKNFMYTYAYTLYIVYKVRLWSLYKNIKHLKF